MHTKKILAFVLLMLLAVAFPAAAETLSSPNYQIENATLDIGGESSSSTSYSSRDSIGAEGDSGSNSSLFKSLIGFIWPSFPGIPAVPTLTNTGGTLYSSLDFIVATGGNQTDTQYAIALSADDFVTTYFVQTDDTLGITEAWQTYANWGSGSGERVTGLSPSTTYKIKVKARYGADSETGYSVTATAATTSPSLVISFSGVASSASVAGQTTTVTTTSNSIPYGSLIPSTPAVAAHKVTVTTNANTGYTTTLQQNNNLRNGLSQEIDPVSGSNSSPSSWPGGITTGRFGYHTTDAVLCTGTTTRFAANDTYAALTSTAVEVGCSTAPVTSEETTVVYKLEIGSLQPSGSYENTLTYITTAQF